MSEEKEEYFFQANDLRKNVYCFISRVRRDPVYSVQDIERE